MKIYCCNCKIGKECKLVTGKNIYPNRRDLHKLLFYQCECGLYVGCHKNSGKTPKPFGCIPTEELRKARMEIHKILDPLWIEKNINRTELYQMLSEELGYKYHTAKIKSIEEARKIYKEVLKIKELFSI